MKENCITQNVLIDAFKDILALKFNKSQTLGDALNQFYDIMLKHGIRQSEPNYNEKGEVVSRTMSTPEWVICYQTFRQQFEFFLTIQDLTDIRDDVK